MSACEPCWNEAYRQSRMLGGSQVDYYLRLIEVLDGHPHDEPAAEPLPAHACPGHQRCSLCTAPPAPETAATGESE